MRIGEGPKVSVFKVPPQVLGKHLAVYLVQFGQILSVTSDNLNGGWSFEIMLDHTAFISVTNCLDVEVQKM